MNKNVRRKLQNTGVSTATITDNTILRKSVPNKASYGLCMYWSDLQLTSTQAVKELVNDSFIP